jgi:hypothetical protein
MGLLTLFVAAAQSCAAFLSFRMGFLLFIFFYATYPRLLALGIGEQGFALTAQRMMLLGLIVLFGLRYVYGAGDARRGMAILWQELGTLLLFLGLLGSRLMGNLLTGRLDLSAIVGFIDETVFTLFIVLLVFSVIRTRRDVHALLLVIALSVFPNEIVTAIEFVTQRSIFPASLQVDFETSRSVDKMLEGGTRFGLYRVQGLFESPLKLMELVVLSIPLVVYLIRITPTGFLRTLLMLILAVQPVVVALTGSRTGIMMLLLVGLAYLYRFVKQRFGRIESAMLLLVFGLVGLSALIIGFDSIVDGFLFSREGSRSTASRFIQYVLSVPLIQASPLFGYGYARNIVDVIDINRMDGYYLRTLMEGGGVGLGCLLALQWRSLRKLYQLRNRDDYHLAFALSVSLGAMAVMMLALNMSTSSFYSYLFFGLTLVIERQARVRAQQPVPIHGMAAPAV